jgi:hypothetical protein
VALPISADVALPAPPVLLRCMYDRPPAPRVVDDRPRLGGCVFSAELTLS